MQTSSFKKLSLLGLILLIASAIAEAVIVNKKKEDHFGDRGGKLIPSSIGAVVLSCVPADFFFECTATGAFFTATSGALFTSRDYPTITNNVTSYAGINTSISG